MLPEVLERVDQLVLQFIEGRENAIGQGFAQMLQEELQAVAMILNGIGFSNRQLYVVPQYFANNPIEQRYGSRDHDETLNDDCLGRTLD